MDPRILELKAHIEELDRFISSGRIYRGWQSARGAALSEVEKEILDCDPKTPEEINEQFRLRGERRLLLRLANQFEDVRDTLKEQLADLEQAAETQDAANQTQDNDQVQ